MNGMQTAQVHGELLQEAARAGYVVADRHIGIFGQLFALDVEVVPYEKTGGTGDADDGLGGDLIFRVNREALPRALDVLSFYREQHSRHAPDDPTLLSFDVAEILGDLLRYGSCRFDNYTMETDPDENETYIRHWLEVFRHLATVAAGWGALR